MPPKSARVPQRRMGMRGITLPENFGLAIELAVMSVSIKPGAMQLTVMLREPNSRARARVMPATPALAAA